MNATFLLKALLAVLVAASLLTSCGRRDAFNIRDVDPGQAGTVRSLGPESQEAIRVSDLMVRSLMSSPAIQQSDLPLTVAMLPMDNNSRFVFNKDVFSQRLRAELNQKSDGALRFIARETMADIMSEREAKRAGEIDYDPARRTAAVAGADVFLRGRIDGLSTASRLGMAEYSLYTFALIDTETGLVLWEDMFEVKKEGRDDVIYR